MSDQQGEPTILVIVGTVRQGRVGRKVADWYVSEARKAAPELKLELLDLAELKLPLFNEPMPPAMHRYSGLQESVAKRVAGADGFVFVTGEYNHGIPGSLKNFLDYVVAEWSHKAAAYVGYGGSGGIRAIEHLIQIMAELRVASIRDHITINAIWQALDERGAPKPGFTHGDIAAQVKELAWWVTALKAAR